MPRMRNTRHRGDSGAAPDVRKEEEGNERHCGSKLCLLRQKAGTGSVNDPGPCPCGCPRCDATAGDARPWHGEPPRDLADAIRRVPGLIRTIVLTPNLGEEP
jgi:hypothetical protein